MQSTSQNSQVAYFSLFTAQDIRDFRDGVHYRLYEKLGSHQVIANGEAGIYFAVWAPNAQHVSVIGNFNQWDAKAHFLYLRSDDSGIWEGFIAGQGPGALYKYHIVTSMGIEMGKGDPFANYWELRPGTSSITCNLDHNWKDVEWMKKREQHNSLKAPWSVYEVNLLSWRRPDKTNENSMLSYLEAIKILVPYVQEMGFTHVELMPVMEYPNDASWGYQGTGFFAPTSRFGSPDHFMQLIDAFHQAGIGVILDWVPSHFPYDAHGLYMFDGTHAYENKDMRRGYHPDWHSYIFDYGKGEVKSFLTSSAAYWADKFHADGLRVDGVSSMLILSYSRSGDQWEPNEMGEDKNLEAIAFLQDLNKMMANDFPGVQVIAEESTAWKDVTAPADADGLGFGMKWMMGWMHDSLEFFALDPEKRTAALDKFRLSMNYYYDEKFILALSHDEVVYGKQSMLKKMPGNKMQQFANLRLFYSYMFTHPGGKLLFMGDEFGSTEEWDFKGELPWNLLQDKMHLGVHDCVKDLNHLLRREPALYENQFEPVGFEWIERKESSENLVLYRRKGILPVNDLVIVLNLAADERHGFAVTAPGKKKWSAIYSSNDQKYGGTGMPINQNNNKSGITIPPLTALIFK